MKWIGYLFSLIWRLWFLLVFILVFFALIPVLFFFTGVHDDYHKPSDDAHKINYNGMKSISNMVEGIVEEFANTPDRLKFKSVEQEQTMSQPAKMKVTLGIMPDYAFDKKGLRADSIIDNRPGQNAGMIE